MNTYRAHILKTIANGGSALIPANAKELQAIRDRNKAALLKGKK